MELGKWSSASCRVILVTSYVCFRCKEKVELKMQLKRWKQTSFSDYKYFSRFLHSFCPYSSGIGIGISVIVIVIVISCFFWNSVIIPIQPNQFHSKKLFTSSPFALRLRLVHKTEHVVDIGVQKTEEKMRFCFLVGRKLVCLCWRWSTIQPQRQYAESLQYIFLN